ncbi:hypothetical protein [Streptomyces sp. NPDC005374]|uniref:hypothetical protein n=1 Tax=Streptomyces sp. NPDC005374 TaxID=3364713 RepID=UPI0036B1E22C
MSDRTIRAGNLSAPTAASGCSPPRALDNLDGVFVAVGPTGGRVAEPARPHAAIEGVRSGPGAS